MPEQLGILLQFALPRWQHVLTRSYRSYIIMHKASYQIILGTTGNEFHRQIFLSFVYGLAYVDFDCLLFPSDLSYDDVILAGRFYIQFLMFEMIVLVWYSRHIFAETVYV